MKFILVCCIVMCITGCGCTKKEKKKNPNIKFNTSEGITKDRVIDGLKFTKTSLSMEDGIATLKATITNDTESDKQLSSFLITLRDGNGVVLVNTLGYVGNVIPAGESRVMKVGFDQELKNARTVEYKLNPLG